MNTVDAINDLHRALALHQAGQLAQAEKLYRDVLRRLPEQPDALNLLGLILSARGQKKEALALYDRALRAVPNLALVHFNRAITLVDLDRIDEAEAAYEAAIKIKPDYADALLNFGGIAFKRKDYATAADRFRGMTQKCPLDPRGFRNLGQALAEAADTPGAIAAYEQAGLLNPNDADTLIKLANCYADLEKFEDAVECIKRAIVLEPANGEIYSNLGNWLAKLERYPAAFAAHDESCRISPARPEFFFNAGNVRLAAGELEAALSLFRRVIALNPDYIAAYVNAGEILKALGRFDEAIALLDASLARAPEDVSAQINKAAALSAKGVARGDTGQHHDALADVEPALRLLDDILRRQPGNVDALARRAAILNNKAEALGNLTNIDGALAAFDQALSADAVTSEKPSANIIRSNKAVTLLSAGRLAEGWPLYRYRFADPVVSGGYRAFPYPEWHGEPLAGKKLLLWADQGIGDEVLYANMLPDIVALGPDQCILECAPRLVALFQRSFPQIQVVPRTAPLQPAIAAFQPDYQSSITDLGAYLRPAASAFPAHTGYLQADAAKRSALRAKYEALAGSRKIVGISWHSASPKTGKLKSLPLTQWGPILQNPGAFFVSLQYGAVDADIQHANQAHRVEIFVDPDINAMGDFDGFAAQVAAMDRIVSVSNTTVHIAGALNVPTLALVPQGRGNLWYFRLGTTVPWYPSVQLLRQDRADQWQGVVEKANQSLLGGA